MFTANGRLKLTIWGDKNRLKILMDENCVKPLFFVKVKNSLRQAKGKLGQVAQIYFCHLPYTWLLSLSIQCLLPSKPENALKQMQQKVKWTLEYYYPDHIPILDGEMRNGSRKLFQHMLTTVLKCEFQKLHF